MRLSNGSVVEICENGQQPLNRLEEPGVLLTFDDRVNVPRWVQQIPLFKKYDVYVTVCVENPDLLTDEQLEGLKLLMAAGHEVASHSVRHVLGREMVKEHGVDHWLEQEILPANRSLETHGIEIKSFAYPNSSNNEKMDQALEPYFRHVRTGASIPDGMRMPDVDRLFVPINEVAKRFLLTGKGIDRADEAWLHSDLFPALVRAKAKKEILMLYAHDICDYSEQHHLKPEMLELVLQRISELNLKSYTLGQLPSDYPTSVHGID